MKRSQPLARTELKRGKPLQRGTTALVRTGPPERRTRLTAKPTPPEVREDHDRVRAAVIARDGGCLMARLEAHRCRGPLTFHHLHKDGQGGAYTQHNGVCLCAFHNTDVEDHPRRYRLLGLVVRPGLDHNEALARRTAARLAP